MFVGGSGGSSGLGVEWDLLQQCRLDPNPSPGLAPSPSPSYKTAGTYTSHSIRLSGAQHGVRDLTPLSPFGT